MRKKKSFATGLFAVSAVCIMSGCGNNATTSDNSNQATAETSVNGLRIAYVEIDSLMSQYNFCKDYTILMNQKGENIRATLASKERDLQNKAAEMQRKYETNQFTTRDQLEKAQMALAKQQQDLQNLNDRLMNDFAEEQAKYNIAMRDSIQAFLKEYNKTKKYDYIISKAGDNLLVANSKYDITNDVINGLNKRYKTDPEVEKQINKAK